MWFMVNNTEFWHKLDSHCTQALTAYIINTCMLTYVLQSPNLQAKCSFVLEI